MSNLFIYNGQEWVNIASNGKDGSPDTPEQIADKLNTLEGKVDKKVIKGLSDLETRIETIANRPQFVSGGGITGVSKIVAGSGVTISPANGQGDVTINSTGGGGSLTVTETDASPSVSSVSTIQFPNGSVVDNGGGNVTVFPTAMRTLVRNSTGSIIYRGMIVYMSGSTGNRPNISKAQANSEATSSRTFGVVIDDIANNADGYVLNVGALENLDTRTVATNPFTSVTLADGDTVYLDPSTAGYITNVKPVAPNHIVYIGKVVRTSPTLGYIVYQIQNGYELDEIHDVLLTTPTNGQVLTYESASGLWKNQTPSGGGGSLTKGIAEVDFGAITTQSDIATVSVADASVTTTSYPSVTMYALATTDHDPDDYMVEGLIPYVTNVQNGVGFDVSVRAPNMTFGKYRVTYQF